MKYFIFCIVLGFISMARAEEERMIINSATDPEVQKVEIAEEAKILKQLGSRATRKGDTLKIKIPGHPDFVRVSKMVDSDAMMDIRAQEYIKEIDSLLLSTLHYEGRTFEILNLRNGDVFGSQDDPYFSPDKHKFVALTDPGTESPALVSGFVVGSCELKKSCRTIFESKEEEHFTRKPPVWNGNSSFSFEYGSFNEENKSKKALNKKVCDIKADKVTCKKVPN